MTQLQFLATLSLVDYTVREESWLADFVTGLRCDGQRLFRRLLIFSLLCTAVTCVSARPSFLRSDRRSLFSFCIGRVGILNGRIRSLRCTESTHGLDGPFQETKRLYESLQHSLKTQLLALSTTAIVSCRRRSVAFVHTRSPLQRPVSIVTPKDGSTSGGQRRLRKILRRKSASSNPGQADSGPWCSWATLCWSWVSSWAYSWSMC